MNMQCYTGGRMVDFLKIVCMLVIYLLVFTMSGTIANRVLGIKRSGGITIIMGFLYGLLFRRYSISLCFL